MATNSQTRWACDKQKDEAEGQETEVESYRNIQRTHTNTY